jgi:hypothetical protein
MATNNHKWHFLATSEGDTDLSKVVIVCEQCGLIREKTVSDGAMMDLTGKCPAAPDRSVHGLSGRRG